MVSSLEPGLRAELTKKVRDTSDRMSRGEPVTLKETLGLIEEFYTFNPNTMVPMLGLLRLNGKPYSLDQHFVMEPLFKLRMPRRTLYKCARQVAKSTSLSARGSMHSVSNPYLRTLFVTPRYEQVRRLSSNYVRPFINESPIRSMFVDESCTQHVLQRSFNNGSTMYFSFAFLDVDRVRGIATDVVVHDEVQDLDYDFVPIIRECMSASTIAMSLYSGTPKTLDNGIQAMWEESSQAEWVTPCEACGHWNVASIHEDLMKMIGLKGIVCGRCQKPINPRMGHWYHFNGENAPSFHGYHVPQIIMPMHYDDPEKWVELLAKRDGKGNYNGTKFLNEVLGESADSGVKLVTITDIKAASQLGPNIFEQAIDKFRRCKVRVLAVDWGGGGEEEVSFTTLALVGLNAITGKIECHYCERFHMGYSHTEEARKLLYYFTQAGCHYFAHDYGGAGAIRETLMIQSRLPIDKVIGFSYVRAGTRDLVVYKKPVDGEFRGYWSLDKARSLVLQAICVKGGQILLPEYETSKNVTHDMLALMEDKHEMPKGSDIYLIRRQAKQSDDFAHALNFGSIAIWHTEQRYPDLSAIQSIKLSEEQLNFAAPPNAFKPGH